MSHYFIDDKSVKSDIRTIEYEYKGHKMSFKTDNGLFSKEHVDYASNILINELPDMYGKVLDLGCGYGPIGIALAKAYHIDLTMVDINSKAVEFSRMNCQTNGVKADIVLSDGLKEIQEVFDNIILNPPIHAGKQVIYNMYEDCYRHLSNGGSFYLIIQKKHGAKTSIEKLETIFEEINTLYKKKGFYVLECIKYDGE